MKKTLIIGGLVLALVVASLPAMAQGRGYGRGPGSWGGGPGWHSGPMMGPDGYGLAGLSEEKVKALNEARQKFFTDTADMRRELAQKRAEMRALFLSKDVTKDQLLAKQKELQTLRNALGQKRLEHRFELQKQFPELANGYGLGRGGKRGGYGSGFCGGPGRGPGYGPGYHHGGRW